MEFINLKTQYEILKDNINNRIYNVMEKGNFILSEEVAEFEALIADYVDMKYVISCGNGTEALQLIYMAYGIGKGDAVFCPDMTFIASIEPAVMLGAHPVFCDIDLLSYNLNIESLENMVKKTINDGIYIPKAIISVDFLGNPSDIDGIREIAKKYGLLVIEDAAQGMGAINNGRKCCSLGDISATSFFPTKPLGCYGDGGAIFTNDINMKNILSSLRVHGKGKTKYDNVRIGLNSRLDSIQAAILIEKLKVLEQEIEKRQEIAFYYSKRLCEYLCVPEIGNNMRSSFAQYVLMAENEKQKRFIVSYLNDKGIPTLYYYPNPLHKLPVFRNLEYSDDYYTNTIAYCERAFAVPFSPYIKKQEQDEVIDAIEKCFENL